MSDRPMERRAFRYHPLLGTMVDVVVLGGSEHLATSIKATVVAEIERLEDVFSTYRPNSELSRWKRDELDVPCRELCAVMAEALDWQIRSAGTYNPLAGFLSRIWADAERTQEVPDIDRLAEAAADIVEPRYSMVDGAPVRTGDCADLELHAIAKGYVVDAAVRAATRLADDVTDPIGTLVSAGGDMRHGGAGTVTVAIENPLRPYDNEPPIASVPLQGAALVTSGGAHRGVTIGSRRFSHALDARTGMPVESQISISIVAPDAMTADVLATSAGPLAPGDAVAMIDRMPDAACLVVDPQGGMHTDRSWRSLANM